MKKLSLVAFMAVVALAVPFASAQVKVNGSRPKITSSNSTKFKDSTATKTVGPKKHRKKFLGIF